MFESGGTRKIGLSRDLSRETYVRVWQGVRGPSLFPENIEFGTGRVAISRCFVELTCTLSLFLVDILSHSHFLPHPTLTISMQIWTNYETHIILKSGGLKPQTKPSHPPCGSASASVADISLSSSQADVALTCQSTSPRTCQLLQCCD